MLGRQSRGLLLIAVLAVGLGCQEQLKPLTLNNFAAANNRKIAKAATEFRAVILPMQRGRPASITETQAAYQKLRTVLAEVRKETNRVGPDYLPQADEFYRTYQGFLDGQERLVEEEFPKILKIVEAPGPPGQKWAQIVPILTAIDKADAADLARLQEVQKRLAEGGNFLPPGGY